MVTSPGTTIWRITLWSYSVRKQKREYQIRLQLHLLAKFGIFLPNIRLIQVFDFKLARAPCSDL